MTTERERTPPRRLAAASSAAIPTRCGWSWRVDSSNDRGVTWQLAKPFEFPATGRQ